MSKDIEKLKEIDNYLSGNLSPEEHKEFEKRLQMDGDLQEEVDTIRRVIAGIQGYAFKKMLSNLHEKHFGKNTEP